MSLDCGSLLLAFEAWRPLNSLYFLAYHPLKWELVLWAGYLSQDDSKIAFHYFSIGFLVPVPAISGQSSRVQVFVLLLAQVVPLQ